MGVGIPPQFGQHVRKVNPRRSVKITHPDTHEELKLDEKVDMKLDGGSGNVHHVGGLPAQPMHYASVQLAMNQAPGSARRELLTSSFPVSKKTMEIEKALQPPLRVGSYVEEPKILSETSVEASESASTNTFCFTLR
ncbi:hypothetical protein HAX54_010823 [Datura stramonium]|uniref:Uncharacterized protein n=1 Tax=Datura stramonium TaxID=4076 RepID=A0ABS8TGV6_DATST|nr:hypothetical protein [Datura stramonium]